jgi:hypothetical protein
MNKALHNKWKKKNEDSYRGRILGRHWGKSVKSFFLAITDIAPLGKRDLKLVCNVNTENSHETSTKLYVHEFGFR